MQHYGRASVGHRIRPEPLVIAVELPHPGDVTNPEPSAGATCYVQQLPIGLLRALFAGRWLPFVGAGFSVNAATAEGDRPPTWEKLGQSLAKDVPDVASANPLEAVSAYAELYGRAALVERLEALLLVDEAEPGAVHAAFARLPFDTVVTTNADFLLEAAYQREHRPCIPLLGESQLSITRRPEVTYLLKFHGDLRHPEDLVMTEEDYDGFLRRKPLLTTYLSWWLLTREPVFFGYSLSDADLREVLTFLRERLGRLARPGWAILPTDRGGRQSARFARRGLRPVVLNSDPEAEKGAVLSQFLTEVRERWQSQVLPGVTAPTDATTAELRRD